MSQTRVAMCQTVFEIGHVGCTSFIDDAFADINVPSWSQFYQLICKMFNSEKDAVLFQETFTFKFHFIIEVVNTGGPRSFDIRSFDYSRF